MQNLCEYNSLTPNDPLYAGTKLNLKSTNDNSEVVNKNVSANEVKMHSVEPKEGLYSISKKYGVTINQIREWNNLQSDNLKVGQQLIISK